jgi:DNA-binding NarL/FixJ family response regulator
MEIKVLAMGRRNVTLRVSNALIDSRVGITVQNDISDAINLLKKDRFDLVLMDGYMDNLESVCYHITRQYRVPVVLVVNGKEADWNHLKTLDIEGFIPEEGRDAEILTYFNSIARRQTYQTVASNTRLIEKDEQTREALRIAFQMC